jgi:glycosyltransferase involved in cell wall biosynthesis
LLVIDDGSSDTTLQIAQAFHDERIRYYSDGKRLGLGDRLNQAIALSGGEFFARMDGDDVAYPHRLEQQIQFLCKQPDVDLVGAQTMVFGMNGSPLGKRGGATHHREICAKPFSGMPISHPTFGQLAWFRH